MLQALFSPKAHIRLMVDVLLTMNEAFCIAGGGVSCPSPKVLRAGD
jgi:hypothetical protein